MQISYVATEQDFIDAQKAHAWRKYKPATQKIFSIVNPCLGAVVIVEAVWLWRIEGFKSVDIFLILLGLYLLLSKIVIAPWLYRRAFRRRHHGPPHEMTMTITDQIIECECRGRSHSTLEWAMIAGMVETQSTLLLYASRATFLYIPKRVLDESKLAELRSIVRAKDIPAGPPKAAKSAAVPNTA